MIEKFREIVADRYRVIRENKEREGKKVIGWVCNYIPEELIHAAGMYPVRVLGGEGETAQADAHLYSNICSFVRSCVEEGFKGEYDFLDGLVTASTCDHTRRLFDVWNRYIPLGFTYQIGLPHKVTAASLEYYRNEIAGLKEGLERFGGVTITDDDLRGAIELFNRTRQLLREVYELRRAEHPPISGAEVLDVVLAGMILPRERYHRMLEELLAALAGRAGIQGYKARLMLTGSLLDNSEYLRVIEELGGLVVADSLCTGTRYFWDRVEPDGDPLGALVRAYLTHQPCPRMRPYTARAAHLKEIAQTFHVDGVICEQIKFCDNAGEEYPMVREALAEIGIPSLTLEREYALGGVGQMKTRVQAFLESVGR